MNILEYENLRSVVRDGDTIAVPAKGIYKVALSLAAMGPYGHVGIVRSVVIDGVTRMMLVEQNPGGGRYTPLSHYKNCTLDVFPPPPGVDGRKASTEAVKMLDGLVHYDWPDILRLARWGVVRAVRRILRLDLPMPRDVLVSETKTGVICSALVASAYIRAGWSAATPVPWPSALCGHLGKPIIQYQP